MVDFTEDFYIACGFMALFLVTVISAAYTGNQVLVNAMGTVGGILGTIAGFYFSKTTVVSALKGMMPPTSKKEE